MKVYALCMECPAEFTSCCGVELPDMIVASKIIAEEHLKANYDNVELVREGYYKCTTVYEGVPTWRFYYLNEYTVVE